MTGRRDGIEQDLLPVPSVWSGKRRDRIEQDVLSVLSLWSGKPPSEHKSDYCKIILAERWSIHDPAGAKERAERIDQVVGELRRIVSSMPRLEKMMFHEAFAAGSIQSVESQLPEFCRGLKFGAAAMRTSADQALSGHPVAKNENRRNIDVALAVSDIFVRETDNEPPKAGADGPFQRLLRDVYTALGRSGVDLRGPLRKVHEYRNNRHS